MIRILLVFNAQIDVSVKVGPRLVVSYSGQENTSHHLRLCFPSNMAAVGPVVCCSDLTGMSLCGQEGEAARRCEIHHGSVTSLNPERSTGTRTGPL